MKAIPICRATTLIPFVRFFSEVGAPVERRLEREHLPLHLLEQPDCYVPTLNNWAFLARVAAEQGIQDAGVRVGDRAGENAMSRGLRRDLDHAPTLLNGIEAFCARTSRENSGMRCWLIPAGEQTRFHLEKSLPLGTLGYEETEWLGLLGMLAVIRRFAGNRWNPPEISLRSKGPVSDFTSTLFPNTRIRMGRPFIYIALPTRLLSLSRAATPSPTTPLPSLLEEAPKRDLVGSLEQALTPYLRDRHTNIELAAEIARTSVRSLQRRLAAEDQSYSALIGRVRFKQASRLLLETNATTLEIAEAVGYTDPSNFTRAFRRMTGLTPNAYREQPENPRLDA